MRDASAFGKAIQGKSVCHGERGGQMPAAKPRLGGQGDIGQPCQGGRQDGVKDGKEEGGLHKQECPKTGLPKRKVSSRSCDNRCIRGC